jgi:hypothetical protein
MPAAQAGEARMFEEVPRARRGLAGLTARRVVLGPFVIGGGVLLAAVGGSVAVAATVLTASGIHASDVPPKPAPHPVVATSSAHRPAPPARHQPVAAVPTGQPAGSLPATAAPAPSASRLVRVPPAAVPSSSGRASSSAAAPSSAPASSPSVSSSGPTGNALIYLTGYDQASNRVLFEFAVAEPGAGPNGSDVYRVQSTRQYSATLAADLTITSGGQLCPPAGSRCSIDQLTAAAGTGFFAIAAIDPADQLHSVIEVDNVGTSFAPAATATATPTPSPTSS